MFPASRKTERTRTTNEPGATELMQGEGDPGPVKERIGYLSIGSNVGDRVGHLQAAVALLSGEAPIDQAAGGDLPNRDDERPAVTVEAVSELYETEPVGEVLDQPDFLNAAVRIRTSLEPDQLLDFCKAIERERGRQAGGQRHGPRPLDVDLILLGDLELSTERLTLPHPELMERRFVLVPMLELDPELALPDGRRLDAALAALGPGQRVTPLG